MESDILAVEAEAPREWPYGIDIDGNIVFDLDAKRSLANMDIHIGRHLWQRGIVPPWPEKAAGTIVFLPETVEHKSFNMHLQLVFDETLDVLHVRFGIGRPDRELELSHECVALLSGDELVGFLMRGF